MNKNRIFTCLLLGALLFGACAAPAGNQAASPVPEAPGPVETPTAPLDPSLGDQGVSMILSDMLGTQIEVDGAPARVVCLSPATAETLFALNVDAAIVGVGINCDYPEAVLDIPKVESLEEILALEPDMVFMGNEPEMLGALANAGVPVACTEGVTYGDVFTSIAFIGQIMGADASSLIQKMQGEVEEAAAQAERLTPQTVYYIQSMAENEHMTAGKGSFVSELITMAGGLPVSGEGPDAWPVYTVENLKSLDPAVLLLSSSYSLESVVQQEGYRDLTAVKEGRVYSVDAVLMDRPGPRIALAVQEIYQALEQAELS